MTVSDGTLILIEQLCYLGPDVGSKAGISGFEGVTGSESGQTIGDILNRFDENALNNLAQRDDKDGSEIAYKEWAGIIRALKNNKEISGMVLQNTLENKNGQTLALCLSNPSDPDNAIIAFNGTTGGDEWKDDVYGMNQADTKCQKEALDYVENQKYQHISVVGHSKGGNKAMYCAVTSDKVDKCVSMDGQGFSDKFIKKYKAEIQKKCKIITNYSASTDFVHPLLFQVPGSTQKYCQGYGIDSFGSNHSPNSIIVVDAEKNVVTENGEPKINSGVAESRSAQLIHKFVAFIMNNASDADKQLLIVFLADLLDKKFGNPPMSDDDLLKYIMNHKKELGYALAYLLEYMKANNLSAEDVQELLKAYGFNELDSYFSFSVNGVKIVGLYSALNYFKDTLTDDDLSDKPFLALIGFANKDVADILIYADGKGAEIHPKGGTDDPVITAGKIRDFSTAKYDELKATINRMQQLSTLSIMSWNNYSADEWFYSLYISAAMNGINIYLSQFHEINSLCLQRVETVFENVYQIDGIQTGMMKLKTSELENIHVQAGMIASSLD